jgi:hypothetical protein
MASRLETRLKKLEAAHSSAHPFDELDPDALSAAIITMKAIFEANGEREPAVTPDLLREQGMSEARFEAASARISQSWWDRLIEYYKRQAAR